MIGVFKYLVMLTLIGFMAGCVSKGSKVETVDLTTQSESGAKNVTSEGGTGRLVFYRDGILGLAVLPKINVNDQPFGRLPVTSYFSCDVPAGAYRIESKLENTANLTIDVNANETQFVRTTIGFGIVAPRVGLEKVDQATAQGKISKLKQTKSTCGEQTAAR